MRSNQPSIRLRRLYCNQDLTSQEVWLTPDESKHALRVLRLQPGDRCLLTTGNGWEAEAELLSSDKKGACFKILARHYEKRGFFIPVAVLPAWIKKGKMDLLLEKAQEFGCASFQPIVCEYSDYDLDPNRYEAVKERWKKIAHETAKQSGATEIIQVDKPATFKDALNSLAADTLVLIFHPHAPAEKWVDAALRLRESTDPKKYQKIYIFIGPEGGFSPAEIEAASMLKHPGIHIIKMGLTILKADTAFIAALAGLSFFINEKSPGGASSEAT